MSELSVTWSPDDLPDTLREQAEKADRIAKHFAAKSRRFAEIAKVIRADLARSTGMERGS